MGVSIDTGGGGGRKSMNVDLNLVPFIDLMSCCISFLLISAVWTQVNRITVNEKKAGKSSAAMQTLDKPPEKLVLIIDNDVGYKVVKGNDVQSFPKKGADYDVEKLGVFLKGIRQAMPPERKDVQVAVGDNVRYDDVVRAMDQCLSAQFPDISLTDSKAAN